MAASGISVNPACAEKYEQLKMRSKDEQNPKLSWIIFKISDDWKTIEVEDSSPHDKYEEFRSKLIAAKSKDKRGNECKGARYAVYDVHYEKDGAPRNKITFFSWVPDDAGLHPRMIYSSSKESLKRALDGVAAEIQANDEDDIEFASVVDRVSKGRS